MRAPDLIDELYDASYGRLVVQMLALCGNQTDAEDAVQEAFVQALRHRDRLGFVDRPEAWLRTVALNHLRNGWRHGKVARRLAVRVPGPRADLDLGPDHVALVAALQQLDDTSRRGRGPAPPRRPDRRRDRPPARAGARHREVAAVP